jgi:hypothetical protein
MTTATVPATPRKVEMPCRTALVQRRVRLAALTSAGFHAAGMQKVMQVKFWAIEVKSA